jgi:hypothetical protein
MCKSFSHDIGKKFLLATAIFYVDRISSLLSAKVKKIGGSVLVSPFSGLI